MDHKFYICGSKIKEFLYSEKTFYKKRLDKHTKCPTRPREMLTSHY